MRRKKAKEKLKNVITIQRKKVKRININIKWDGRVLVSVPTDINDDIVEKVLEEKAKWIAEKLKEVEVKKKYLSQFVDGGNVWFIGKPYTLRISDGEKDEVSLKDKELLVKVANRETERIKYLVVNWLKKQAVRIIKEKVNKFEEVLDLKPEGIKFKEWKSAWGICDTKTMTLEFNWKLIHLPNKLIDYVVVHELAHLKYPNHGGNFWKLVARALPDCKERDKELKGWSILLA